MPNGTQTKRVKFERMDRVVPVHITENSLHLSCNGKLHVNLDVTCLQIIVLNIITFLAFFARTAYSFASLYNDAINSANINMRPPYCSQKIILLNFTLDYQYFSIFT